MITVQIHFHGAIDRRGMAQDHRVSCPPQTTVEALLRQLGYSERQLLSIVPFMAGKRVSMGQELCDGDAIDVLAPAGGG